MCGIFGLVASDNCTLTFAQTQDIVDELFALSETRGKESSGLAIKKGKTGEIRIFKAPLPATTLTRRREYKSFFQESLEDCYSAGGRVANRFSLIAHARLVTNGSQDDNSNNQPVSKSGAVAVHNGIIVNVDQLWRDHSDFKREYQVDTEILLELLCRPLNGKISLQEATREAFNKIEGAASVGVLFSERPSVLITTNTGSLYFFESRETDAVVFSSERYILESLIERKGLRRLLAPTELRWVRPKEGWVIDEATARVKQFNLAAKTNGDQPDEPLAKPETAFRIRDCSPGGLTASGGARINSQAAADPSLLEFRLDEIDRLRRCTRCLLPETFPYIVYRDEDGVCNYCLNYTPQQILGLDALREYVESFRKRNGEPDCLVTFSGGRDSSYGLHIVTRELGLTPIAYTYDWGMVTDLARRNQARLCGKLGVEHILISADINRKRANIRKNVLAWLKSPNLGTVPLFMAGDKQYFYYANKLREMNKLNLVILCENMLETTMFKSGFCGIKPKFSADHTYTISAWDKAKMVGFYGRQYLGNRAYLNQSLIDTVGAFASYYFIPHDYLNVYRYVRWEEPVVEKTLLSEYDWETSPDTRSTWRIGDGTAAFYNYIYYNVTGFSEIDTFRSNQIREGMLTRDAALQLVNDENQPRFESVKWYLDTIGLDFNTTIRRINSIPKLYRNRR